MNGPLTWVAGVVIGVATMLGIQILFRTLVEAGQLLPLAQAIGFIAAWVVIWPYARDHFVKVGSGFLRYLCAGVAPSLLIAALRIAFRTG